MWSINETSYKRHIRILSNRPVSLIVEPESSPLTLWYSGGQFPSVLSFNSIKQIIETSDDILDMEIEGAKLSRNPTNIGTFIRFLFAIYRVWFSAMVTMKVFNKKVEIRKMLRYALRRLQSEGKICDTEICACNGFYELCPFRRNSRTARRRFY